MYRICKAFSLVISSFCKNHYQHKYFFVVKKITFHKLQMELASTSIFTIDWWKMIFSLKSSLHYILEFHPKVTPDKFLKKIVKILSSIPASILLKPIVEAIKCMHALWTQVAINIYTFTSTLHIYSHIIDSTVKKFYDVILVSFKYWDWILILFQSWGYLWKVLGEKIITYK